MSSPADSIAPSLELSEVVHTFYQAGSAIEVLKGASLSVLPGEMVALVGPSGAGKSTLLQIAGLLERPGAGAVMVSERLVPFLPTPVVERREEDGETRYALGSPPQSIGRMGAFHGNFGALVRAYSYIRTLGDEGIARISEDAVVNANYVLSQLRDDYELPYDRTCFHEVVLSASNLKQEHDVSALDVAKRLIDYGIHPPTMYFPLIVDEALMIEPTETESLETLDHFIAVMKAIAREAREDPDLVRSAPHDTPNTRLDEATAARRPDLRWRPASE